MASLPAALRRLGPGDVSLLRALNALFGDAPGDRETYGAEPPTGAYLECLLGEEHVVVSVAPSGDGGLGGLVACELDEIERTRREPYIHGFAAAAGHRRRGIGTALIERLREIAAGRGAWVVYVQADRGDDPAIALYAKLGEREDVLHFDISVEPRSDRPRPAHDAETRAEAPPAGAGPACRPAGRGP